MCVSCGQFALPSGRAAARLQWRSRRHAEGSRALEARAAEAGAAGGKQAGWRQRSQGQSFQPDTASVSLISGALVMYRSIVLSPHACFALVPQFSSDAQRLERGRVVPACPGQADAAAHARGRRDRGRVRPVGSRRDARTVGRRRRGPAGTGSRSPIGTTRSGQARTGRCCCFCHRRANGAGRLTPRLWLLDLLLPLPVQSVWSRANRTFGRGVRCWRMNCSCALGGKFARFAVSVFAAFEVHLLL